jgi:hypothetical protein
MSKSGLRANSGLVLTCILVSAVGLAACQRQKRSEVVVGGHRLAVAERLSCPERQGRLERVSQASDGQSCVYSGPGETHVTVFRVALAGRSAANVLQDTRLELGGLVPTPPSLTHPGESIGSEESTAGQHGASGTDGHEQTRIDLPGLHIHTDGDKASVILPGVNINAEGEKAHISTGIGELKNATIDAVDGAVRITSDMTDAGNVDQSWMVATDKPGAAGWRSVGYVARGPLAGPLVVARMQSRSERHHDHGSGLEIEDIRRLVGQSLK